MTSSLLLALVLASAQSQESPRSPEKEKLVQKEHQNKSDNSAPTSRGSASVVVNIDRSIHRESELRSPVDSESISEGWLNKFWSDPVATFTGALFGVTVVLAGIGWIQWGETRNTAKRQHRAYVALDEIRFETRSIAMSAGLPDGSTRSWTDEQYTNRLLGSFKNFGVTPAHHVSIECESTQTISDGYSYPYTETGFQSTGQMIHPTQIYSTRIPVMFHATNVFVVYGRIIYMDIYKRWWITNFCFSNDGNGNLTPEGDHNREDGPYKKHP